jgi:hypothetical protein
MNVTKLIDDKPSAIQVAKKELADEQLQVDVKRLKRKYKELVAAEKVLKNLTTEVADLEEAISEGD